MTDSDTTYFARRSEQERLAAQAAADPQIAAVHAEMAELYETAARVTGHQMQTPIRLVGDPTGA
jgi:hypothetical protein